MANRTRAQYLETYPQLADVVIPLWQRDDADAGLEYTLDREIILMPEQDTDESDEGEYIEDWPSWPTFD